MTYETKLEKTASVLLDSSYQLRRQALDRLYEQGLVSAEAHNTLLSKAQKALSTIGTINALAPLEAAQVLDHQLPVFTRCLDDFDTVLKLLKATESLHQQRVAFN